MPLMWDDLSTDQLLNLAGRCRAVLPAVQQLQQDEETVLARRPGLAGRPAEALRQLLVPLEDLARDLVQTARGSDTASQAAAPPVEGEEATALDWYAVPREGGTKLVGADVGTTWFGHLMRWERRHNEVVDALVADLTQTGATHALAEIGLTEVAPIPQTVAVRERLAGRFDTTAADLVSSMRRGTTRSTGLIHLLREIRTLGAVALYVRRLTDAVRPTLELMADRVTWIAYSEGYRLAAIEGTHAMLEAAGAMPFGGQILTTATVSADVLATLPRYAWAGPQDRETCGACQERRGYVTYAFSVTDMPACQEVCGLGDSCRHFWKRVEG